MISKPVIIIGMHRSGTSLVSRILEKIGVFCGSVKDNYNESVLHQVVNDYLFGLDNCRWDDTACLERLFANEMRRKRAEGITISLMDELFRKMYFGRYEKGANGTESLSQQYWSFKDPRNTFTLPIWLACFPRAKVIHVIRNGIDVAASLWKRETSRPEGTSHPHYSLLCQQLEGCLSLWSCYVRKGLSYSREKVAVHQLYFEDLLDQPHTVLRSIVDFLEMPDTGNLEKAEVLIDVSRRYSFCRDRQLDGFVEWAMTVPLMRQLYNERLAGGHGR